MSESAEWKAGYAAGMSRAANIIEDQHPCGATCIRTVRDGGNPCEDCGYPLPSHDPTCVARGLSPRGLLVVNHFHFGGDE
jgi:predicted amidophosphoribosyltransferase